MKTVTIHIILFFCFAQIAYSQVEDGVVAMDIPARNSLMFNRYVTNPTFSFVREQSKYITITNKRELVAVEDAPLTYLVNYSGRIKENIGAGVGVYQQNYGVLTTFGGIVNFAYNVRIQEESNFTFGINVGAYKSGLNTGKVVTNFDDPALDKIPSNFLLTINPGLNYGTGFMDFGVSYNNLVTYNFNSSSLLEENPKQGLQGHMMYTGYFGGYGFFGESRFSALARSEFQKEATIVSGVVMLTVPKGVWAQVGYNTMYGASGGIGINLTPQIAIEYNYEKQIAGLTNLGAAHEITLAYRFKNHNHYEYSTEVELAGLINTEKKRKKKKGVAKAPTKSNTEEQARLAAEEQARLASEEQARLASEEQTRLASEEQARLAAEEQARLTSEEQARLASEEKARLASEEQTRLASEEQARLTSEEQTRLTSEEQARLASEEKARLVAEKNAKQSSIKNPTDNIGKSINELSAQTEKSRITQALLLEKLETAVVTKERDLKDLKEENDLSEQNIYVEPKPFKSVSKENDAIELLKIELDEIILRQKMKIVQLESLLKERVEMLSNPNDETNLFYLNKIATLKRLQDKAVRNRESLVSSLEQISIATDFERKRRIKRAAYDNDQDRYSEDRIMLNSLRQGVSLSETSLIKDDFDFGKERNSNNIQILKNVKNTESAFYLVLATHSDVNKRDKFLTQVISTGYKEVDFFYDVNTSEYYIYSKKFYSIQEAEDAIRTKAIQPYNEKTTIIKIEN